MTKEEKISLASTLLNTEPKDIECNSTVLKSGVLYYSLPEKGGFSLLVGDDGEVLYADSSVSFSNLIKAYESGIRTPKACFASDAQ